MTPDSTKHDPRPEYIRSLLDRAGVSQQEAARRLGISARMMRYYVADSAADHRPAPYLVQFALENLASLASNQVRGQGSVLCSEQAMAILEDAYKRLTALGLHCGYGPDCTFPDSEMSAVLRVSTSVVALDECVAASLIGGDYATTPVGQKHYDKVFSELVASRAIGKAMHGG